MRKDPRNNAIPVLHAFQIPGVEDWGITAMLMFRTFASPLFHCRLEFIDLFRQLLAIEYRSSKSNLSILIQSLGLRVYAWREHCA